MPVTITHRNPVAFPPSPDLLLRLKLHLQEQGGALCNALGHVAGEAGRGKGVALIADVAAARNWSPSFARRLTDLRGLLLLDHFDGASEDDLFEVALLDPMFPEAEACMWHADRLEDLLEAVDYLPSSLAGIPDAPRDPVKAGLHG